MSEVLTRLKAVDEASPSIQKVRKATEEWGKVTEVAGVSVTGAGQATQAAGDKMGAAAKPAKEFGDQVKHGGKQAQDAGEKAKRSGRDWTELNSKLQFIMTSAKLVTGALGAIGGAVLAPLRALPGAFSSMMASMARLADGGDKTALGMQAGFAAAQEAVDRLMVAFAKGLGPAIAPIIRKFSELLGSLSGWVEKSNIAKDSVVLLLKLFLSLLGVVQAVAALYDQLTVKLDAMNEKHREAEAEAKKFRDTLEGMDAVFNTVEAGQKRHSAAIDEMAKAIRGTIPMTEELTFAIVNQAGAWGVSIATAKGWITAEAERHGAIAKTTKGMGEAESAVQSMIAGTKDLIKQVESGSIAMTDLGADTEAGLRQAIKAMQNQVEEVRGNTREEIEIIEDFLAKWEGKANISAKGLLLVRKMLVAAQRKLREEEIKEEEDHLKAREEMSHKAIDVALVEQEARKQLGEARVEQINAIIESERWSNETQEMFLERKKERLEEEMEAQEEANERFGEFIEESLARVEEQTGTEEEAGQARIRIYEAVLASGIATEEQLKEARKGLVAEKKKLQVTEKKIEDERLKAAQVAAERIVDVTKTMVSILLQENTSFGEKMKQIWQQLVALILQELQKMVVGAIARAIASASASKAGAITEASAYAATVAPKTVAAYAAIPFAGPGLAAAALAVYQGLMATAPAMASMAGGFAGGFATGGEVMGQSGTDNLFAAVTAREHVTNVGASTSPGARSFLNRLNENQDLGQTLRESTPGGSGVVQGGNLNVNLNLRISGVAFPQQIAKEVAPALAEAMNEWATAMGGTVVATHLVDNTGR